jgi:predicted small lipoprotein YifL
MLSLPRLRNILLGLLAAIALSGCGQKGDLYLPEKTSASDHPARSIPATG